MTVQAGYNELRLKPGDLVRHKTSKRLAVFLQIYDELGIMARLTWIDNGRSGRKYVQDLEVISRTLTT